MKTSLLCFIGVGFKFGFYQPSFFFGLALAEFFLAGAATASEAADPFNWTSDSTRL
jgi:hypothetical protein